jgi:hypothetical protein
MAKISVYSFLSDDIGKITAENTSYQLILSPVYWGAKRAKSNQLYLVSKCQILQLILEMLLNNVMNLFT